MLNEIACRSSAALCCFAVASHGRIRFEVTDITFTVEYEREDDGRWLAEVVELPGVLAYGQISDEAIAKAQALALRLLADRLEHGDSAPEFVSISFAAA
jgi:predicted RNase H-like HicB family nuclease